MDEVSLRCVDARAMDSVTAVCGILLRWHSNRRNLTAALFSK